MDPLSAAAGVLLQIPFTLAIFAALITAAVWTHTHRREIAAAELDAYGYAPRHLLRMQWGRIFTSLFFTIGGVSFYASLTAAALFIGSLEWKFGSLRAATLFFGLHAATILLESLLIVSPLRYFQHPLGNLLHLTHDVGPSAGYYGCLGAFLWLDQWSWLAIALVSLFLLVRAFVSVLFSGENSGALSADIAHLIAFSLGLASGFCWPA